MPASPISKLVDESSYIYPHLEKVIIPDDNTAHYFKVGFTDSSDKEFPTEKPYAWLMCCYIEDDVLDEERWGHVEELGEMNKSILDTIKAVLGISFHEKIGA